MASTVDTESTKESGYVPDDEKCKEHTSNDVSAWCVQCNEEVCIDCVLNTTTKKHEGHTFRERVYLAIKARNIRESMKDEIRQILQEYDAALTEQEEIKSAFDEDTANLRGRISDRRQEVQGLLDAWVDKTQADLTEKVNHEQEILRNVKAKLRSRRDELKTALDSDNTDMAKVVEDLTRVKRDLNERYTPSEIRLKENDVTKQDWGDLIGHISTDDTYGSITVDTNEDPSSVENNGVDSEEIYQELNAKLVVSDQVCFRINCKANANIRLATRTPDGVLVACAGSRCISHLNSVGETVKRTNTTFGICDIGENRKQILHATVYEGHKVMKKFTLFWETVVNSKPLNTYGLTFAPNDDILVCLQKEQEANITRYSPSGRVLKIFDLKKYSPTLSIPRYVEVTVKNDILVSDNEHIIAIDKNEVVEHVCTGCTNTLTGTGSNRTPDRVSKRKGGTDAGDHVATYTEPKDGNELQPDCISATDDQISTCIATDTNYIYILDNNKRAITVLDMSRNVVATAENLLAKQASCVVFDKKGNMWVACREGKMYMGKPDFK